MQYAIRTPAIAILLPLVLTLSGAPAPTPIPASRATEVLPAVSDAATPTQTPPVALSAAETPSSVATPAKPPAEHKKRVKKVPRHVPIVVSRYERRVPPSLYHGKYFVAKWESNRRCIVWRESNNNPRARNRYSSAAGLYQFILSTSNYVARLIHRSYLVGTPASTWPRKIQDHAFWRLFDHRRGAHHWRAGAGYSCQV